MGILSRFWKRANVEHAAPDPQSRFWLDSRDYIDATAYISVGGDGPYVVTVLIVTSDGQEKVIKSKTQLRSRTEAVLEGVNIAEPILYDLTGTDMVEYSKDVEEEFNQWGYMKHDKYVQELNEIAEMGFDEHRKRQEIIEDAKAAPPIESEEDLVLE